MSPDDEPPPDETPPVVAPPPLARRPTTTGSGQIVLAGIAAGVAAPITWVGWLNRGGPGDVCSTSRDGGQACIEEWSPWPFLVVAVVLLGAALVLLRGGVRARRSARASGVDLPSAWVGAGWAAVALLGCLGVLGILTIGIVVLPVAALLAASLVGRRQPRSAGLLVGLAAFPLLLIAAVNRTGPIDSCRALPDGGQLCESVPNPWPFALAAAVALTISAFLIVTDVRRQRSRPAATTDSS